MLDHGPVHIPIEDDVQAMGAQGLDAIEIGQVHLTQRFNLARAEVHGAQRGLIAFGQTTDRVHQYSRDQIGFFRALHRSYSQIRICADSAAR